MEEKKFKDNDWIIKQGDDGDELYVVDSGNLDCFRKTNNEEKLIKVYIKNNFSNTQLETFLEN